MGSPPVMGCAQIDHTRMVSCALSEAPAVGVACLAPVKREITFSPLDREYGFTPVMGSAQTRMGSPQLWGAHREGPHSVWSCALSEYGFTCGGRCLVPCTSQEGNNLSPLDWCKQYLREYGFTPVMGCGSRCAQIDHTPYGLVRSPRAPAVGVACLAPVKRGNNLSPLDWQYLREYGFTPVMGCAQIDHTPYGLRGTCGGRCCTSRGITCGGRCLPSPQSGEITVWSCALS